MVAFINFSGGLDSTYFLWRQLSNEREPVLVHHCRFSSRAKNELKAARGVLKEMHLMGLTHFEYVETACSFPQKPDRDVVTMSAMGAFAARRHRVHKVLLCYSLQESRELHEWLKSGKMLAEFQPQHRYSVANMAFQTIYRKNPVEFFIPEQEKGLISRERMIQELPDNVLRHISFCRRPKENQRFCGSCFTCVRTIPYLRKHKKMELCSREP